jgi:hypothetical protein
MSDHFKLTEIVGSACLNICDWAENMKNSPIMIIQVRRGEGDGWSVEATYQRRLDNGALYPIPIMDK